MIVVDPAPSRIKSSAFTAGGHRLQACYGAEALARTLHSSIIVYDTQRFLTQYASLSGSQPKAEKWVPQVPPKVQSRQTELLTFPALDKHRKA